MIFRSTIYGSCFIAGGASIARLGDAAGYEAMVAFPFAYALIFAVSLGRVPLRESNAPILQVGYAAIQWLRFVLMPFVVMVSGSDAGNNVIFVGTDSLSAATMIMLVELLFGSFLVTYLIAPRGNVTGIPRNLRLEGSPIVYGLFLIFAVLVGIWANQREQILHFLVLPPATERLGDITDTSLVVSRQVVLVALFVLFMAVTSRCARLWTRDPKLRYLILPLLLALLNVSLIVGERRSAQVLTGSCAILVLLSCFPKYRKLILMSVGGVAAGVLLMMTLYKSFGVLDGSYGATLLGFSINPAWISQSLQAYFSGPQVLAAVLESRGSILNAGGSGLFDVLRSTVPVSFFMKDDGSVTSVLFNEKVYYGRQGTGQVVSAAGWGYLYMGVWLFWLAPLVNIVLVFLAERFVARASNLETLYLGGYILARCLVNVTANPPALLSGASMMLMTGGLLYLVAKVASVPVRSAQRENGV